MSLREILLATRSEGKLRELRQMTADGNITWRGLAEFPAVAEVVEDGDTFLANATKKAVQYARATGLPALADDSGLVVDALNSAPGVHSAYYAGLPRDDAANNRKLIADLAEIPQEKRAARFHCVMVLADAAGKVICQTEGNVAGQIANEPRGENGFGYDPHFHVIDFNRRMAELEPERKNHISHRGKALRAMLTKIREYAAE